MNSAKIRQFITLAGQNTSSALRAGTEEERKLGAHLLLSEVLEYVIKGLGVVPEVAGVAITDPESVKYTVLPGAKPHYREMLDGLADVAYTMYWNSETFGIPLEEGFDLVCDNNLQKFVRLDGWSDGERQLERSEWHVGLGVKWPEEVATVQVIRVDGIFFAVGKDARGKVRKPSTYRQVELESLLAANG